MFKRQLEHAEAEHFSKEIQANLLVRYENPPESVQFLIESVRSYKLDNENESVMGEFHKVSLTDYQTKEETIQYDFPRSIRLMEAICENKNPMMPPIQIEDMQYDLIEHHWHTPILFSLFGPKTFCKLLTAVLLEKSIVFVHGNPSVVSSVILALKTLIRPF